MTRRGAVAAVAVALLVMATGACGGSKSSKGVVLDGRPRVPDAEGVVEKVDRQHLVLDGGRTYKVSPTIQSFASQTMATVSLLQRQHQYVHVGLDGHTAVWVAAIGAVLPLKPPVVYYQGKLAKTSDRRVVFQDGTVLTLGPGVTVPAKAGFVRATIDPSRHVVTAVEVP